MCRSIKVLRRPEPPLEPTEISAAALQFVRKLSGTTRPSQRNQAAFDHAVEAIAESAHELLHSLETNHHPRNREEVAAKAKAKSALRFA